MYRDHPHHPYHHTRSIDPSIHTYTRVMCDGRTLFQHHFPPSLATHPLPCQPNLLLCVLTLTLSLTAERLREGWMGGGRGGCLDSQTAARPPRPWWWWGGLVGWDDGAGESEQFVIAVGCSFHDCPSSVCLSVCVCGWLVCSLIHSFIWLQRRHFYAHGRMMCVTDLF